MRFVILMLCVVACGEKRNPDRCCVSEADCATIGLPNGSTCGGGQLCRGNECIELPCATSSECDPAAPYCEQARCSSACSSDEACPGADELTNQYFCVAGSCAQCRDTSDCDDQVCVNGACEGCTSDSQCDSGVCIMASKTCAPADQIAWVTPSGSPSSACTKSSPCTLTRALDLLPPRETIKFDSGTYDSGATIAVTGKRILQGNGVEATRITNSGTGPVISVAAGADVTISTLQVFGAKSGAQPGNGIRCADAKLRVDQVHVLGNASDGIDARCDAAITGATIKTNGGVGARLVGSATASFTVQRSLIARNAGGINAKGRGTVGNSFVVNNTGGISLDLQAQGTGLQTTGPSIDFVTFTGALFCRGNNDNQQIPLTNVLAVDSTFANALTLNNLPVCTYTACVTRGSVVADCTNVTLAFANEANDDFHLTTVGAPVTNSAVGGTGQLDFDGEVRPKGAAADLGADEAQ